MVARGRFSEIAGHPALDLVNTVQWRLSPQRFEDDLTDYDDVLRWSLQLETIDDGPAATLEEVARRQPRQASDEAERMRALREAVYDVMFQGAAPDLIEAEYREAVTFGRLSPEDGDDDGWRWRFPVDLALPRHAVALVAFDALVSADRSKLAQCQDAECGWVFLDSSPRHNRRWCVSADCGNRNRVRDFYQRARATPPPA